MMIAIGVVFFVFSWLLVNIFGTGLLRKHNTADYIGAAMFYMAIICFVIGFAKLSFRYLA